jgi:hypothetical protein
VDWRDYWIEERLEHSGSCDDCGDGWRAFGGSIWHDRLEVAAYTARVWPNDTGLLTILLQGEPRTRAVHLWWTPSGEITVIDPISDRSTFTQLRRGEVIGTPLAEQVFAFADAVLLRDTRLGMQTRATDA